MEAKAGWSGVGFAVLVAAALFWVWLNAGFGGDHADWGSGDLAAPYAVGPVSETPPPIYWVQTRMSEIASGKTQGKLHAFSEIDWNLAVGQWTLIVFAYQGEGVPTGSPGPWNDERLGKWLGGVRRELIGVFGAEAELWFSNQAEITHSMRGIVLNEFYRGCSAAGSWCMDRYLLGNVAVGKVEAINAWKRVPLWLAHTFGSETWKKVGNLDNEEVAGMLMMPCAALIDPRGVLWNVTGVATGCTGSAGSVAMRRQFEQIKQAWGEKHET